MCHLKATPDVYTVKNRIKLPVMILQAHLYIFLSLQVKSVFHVFLHVFHEDGAEKAL